MSEFVNGTNTLTQRSSRSSKRLDCFLANLEAARATTVRLNGGGIAGNLVNGKTVVMNVTEKGLASARTQVCRI